MARRDGVVAARRPPGRPRPGHRTQSVEFFGVSQEQLGVPRGREYVSAAVHHVGRTRANRGKVCHSGPVQAAAGQVPIGWGTPVARWVLLATVTGSGLAFLDVTTGDFRATEIPTVEGLLEEIGRVAPREVVLARGEDGRALGDLVRGAFPSLPRAALLPSSRAPCCRAH